MATLPDSPPCFADAPLVGAGRRARGDPAVLPRRHVRDLRGAAAQRPPRRHAGDRRQGAAHHRRDQGVARRPDRRRQMVRLSRLLRPLLLGGAGGLRARSVRRRQPRPRLRRADRRRPLRCRDRPRGALPAARRGAAQGGDACASPAAPRGGSPATSIPGLAGLDWISGGRSSSRRIAAARGCPAGHSRSPNCPRHCRSGWDRRAATSSSRTIARSRRCTAKISGVSPRLLPRLGLARRASNCSAPSRQPICAARISGVVPSLLWMSGRAPRPSMKASQVRSRPRTRMWSAPSPVEGSRWLTAVEAGLDEDSLGGGAVALAHRLQEGEAVREALRGQGRGDDRQQGQRQRHSMLHRFDLPWLSRHSA